MRVQAEFLPSPSASGDADQRPTSGKQPAEDKSSGNSRRKRRWDGASNWSSSDEDGGGRTRDTATSVAATAASENPEPEEARARANSSNAGSRPAGRGRGRKNSGVGREAVAFLLEASKSRRDSDPASPLESEPKGVKNGVAVRGRGGGSATDSIKADEWVSCDHKNCGKWRRLPPGMNLEGVDKW